MGMIFNRVNIPSIAQGNLANLSELERNLIRTLDSVMSNLFVILARGITFQDNLECVFIDYTSNGVVNTEDTVAHTLGKIPTGFITARIDKAGIVYDGGTTWTKTNIYLKCSAATAVTRIVLF